MNARTLLEAMTLWEGTGTSVAQAAQAVSGLLSDHGIGNLIAGVVAVQLHGYPRTTVDVDMKEYRELWDALEAEPPGPIA